MDKISKLEDRLGIVISHTHFISKEDVKYYDIPTFHANRGDGTHEMIVKVDGQNYLTQSVGVKSPNRAIPIPYWISGRN